MNYTRSQAKAYARQNMTGVWAAIPYPFTKDHALDEAGLRKNVSYYIENNLLDGIFCGHFMSEFYSLTKEERKLAAEAVVDETRGRVQTIVQTGHTSVQETVELTHHAERIGATYAALGNPYFMAYNDEAIYQYFKYVTDRTDIGFLISNAGYTGINLSPQLVSRLADLENIVAVKNPQPIMHTLETLRLAGDRIIVSDPTESNWFLYMVHFGFRLYMSSPAPYTLQRPGFTPIKDYTALALAGKIDEAAALAYKLEPMRKLREKWYNRPWSTRKVLPIAYLKAWTELMGQVGGEVRLPLLPVTAAEREEMRRDLQGVGLI